MEGEKMNAYDKFSYYYDDVMASLRYEWWLDFIKPYVKPSDRILDLACGSGTFAILLSLSGYQAEGLDLSPSIIDLARQKAKINHLTIPFYVQDMTTFSIDQTFDCITCFFDSVNFLKESTDLDRLFETVYRHLKPNGYFIFDVFSKTMMNRYKHYRRKEDYQSFKLDWKTSKIDERTLKHTLAIKENDQIYRETYYEYYHEIKNLNPKGFKLIKISGDFNDHYQKNDERILMVLQRL